ncbi:hypothetical protein [Methylibium rhizosphaerae]|uniref:hypothetical protein n=1 Tax=Methylibium rhizosphaerae TaxID=2570323 RepID=UPI00112C512B|nr:hypothetical protein [Methylibium rhizosphaerae]
MWVDTVAKEAAQYTLWFARVPSVLLCDRPQSELSRAIRKSRIPPPWLALLIATAGFALLLAVTPQAWLPLPDFAGQMRASTSQVWNSPPLEFILTVALGWVLAMVSSAILSATVLPLTGARWNDAWQLTAITVGWALGVSGTLGLLLVAICPLTTALTSAEVWSQPTSLDVARSIQRALSTRDCLSNVISSAWARALWLIVFAFAAASLLKALLAAGRPPRYIHRAGIVASRGQRFLHSTAMRIAGRMIGSVALMSALVAVTFLIGIRANTIVKAATGAAVDVDIGNFAALDLTGERPPLVSLRAVSCHPSNAPDLADCFAVLQVRQNIWIMPAPIEVNPFHRYLYERYRMPHEHALDDFVTVGDRSKDALRRPGVISTGVCAGQLLDTLTPDNRMMNDQKVFTMPASFAAERKQLGLPGEALILEREAPKGVWLRLPLIAVCFATERSPSGTCAEQVFGIRGMVLPGEAESIWRSQPALSLGWNRVSLGHLNLDAAMLDPTITTACEQRFWPFKFDR